MLKLTSDGSHQILQFFEIDTVSFLDKLRYVGAGLVRLTYTAASLPSERNIPAPVYRI